MNPIRVLIVDDHEVVRRGTREIIEQHADLEVVGEAQDGQEAALLAERLQPDVVLMDVTMPGINGIEATRLVKRVAPTAAVLGLSAFDDDPFVLALLEAGAAGYLLKNIRGPQLVEAVRAVKRGESMLQPEIAARILSRFAPRSRPADKSLETERLTRREVEVLREAARGLSNKEIAARLKISTRTVQVHLANVFDKLEVGSRTEAVLRGLRIGIISLADAAP